MFFCCVAVVCCACLCADASQKRRTGAICLRRTNRPNNKHAASSDPHHAVKVFNCFFCFFVHLFSFFVCDLFYPLLSYLAFILLHYLRTRSFLSLTFIIFFVAVALALFFSFFRSVRFGVRSMEMAFSDITGRRPNHVAVAQDKQKKAQGV